jgi:hypothetical protein
MEAKKLYAGFASGQKVKVPLAMTGSQIGLFALASALVQWE